MQIAGILLDDKEQWFCLSTGRVHSHSVLYKHTSGTLTCAWLKISAASSTSVIPRCESAVKPQNSVFFVEVSSVYLWSHTGQRCHGPALMLSGRGPRFCKLSLWYNASYYQCQGCVKVYSQVLYRLHYADGLTSLELDILSFPSPGLYSWFNLNILALIQVLISARQASRFFEETNQVSFGSIAI